MKKYLFVLVFLGMMVQSNSARADFQGLFQTDDKAGQLAEAKANLRAISTAMETYSAANAGSYPTDIQVLLNANPPYLTKNYCNVTIDGYGYTCAFTNATYTITATPVKGGQAVSITTGGSLQ